MNLPERRDNRADAASAKTGIRPRPIQSRDPEAAPTPDGEAVIHFTCPACLRMMSAPRLTSAQECPHCAATVMPPQVVAGARSTKTPLPAPTKTGRLK